MSYYRQGPFRPGGPGVRLGVPGLTPAIRGLMIACAGVWFLQFVLSAAGVLWTAAGGLFPQAVAGPWSAARMGYDLLTAVFGVTPSLTLRGWFWQPVSYIFLHGPRDPFHLLFNMLLLWMFGSELERYWGSRGFLRYFLVCGTGAGVLVVLLGLLGEQSALVPTIGASGALFGLFTAYGMVFAERTVLFMLIFPMKARTMALIMAGLAFFYLVGQPGSGVSHVAHLGGAVTGFLYLKRAWRFGQFYRELKWRYLRRRFKVVPPQDDHDRWLH